MIKIKNQKAYPCFIYTLDGIFEAIAKNGYWDSYHKQFVAKIESLDKKHKMTVSESTFDHKFWNEEKPTFYRR